MKYLVFLFWIPAFLLLDLSIHQEIMTEKSRGERKPAVSAREGHRIDGLLLRLGSAVGTAGCVEAVFGDHEALDGLAVHDVGLDDLVDIGGAHAPVPNGVRVDDDGRAMLALVETSRHVGAHAFLQSAQCEFLLELKLQLRLCLRIAAAARMARITLVTADKQVPFELRHDFNVQDFERGF